MKTLLEMITIEMKEAFKAAGYDEELARVTLSNRPDLCEYQCNGAMAGAKKYKKAPIMIANAVVEELADSKYFASAEAVNPGRAGGSSRALSAGFCWRNSICTRSGRCRRRRCRGFRCNDSPRADPCALCP